jgi:hypothetical protein
VGEGRSAPGSTPPAGSDSASSTGIAQIFAKTAIRARNWAVSQGLISGANLDAEDWHVMQKVWTSLHDDGNYNISTVPLVLFQGGTEVGVTGQRLTYSDDDIRKLFARYNGVGADSDHYGAELFGVYQIFDSYNARRR